MEKIGRGIGRRESHPSGDSGREKQDIDAVKISCD
jgi:hypothetical protein